MNNSHANSVFHDAGRANRNFVSPEAKHRPSLICGTYGILTGHELFPILVSNPIVRSSMSARLAYTSLLTLRHCSQ